VPRPPALAQPTETKGRGERAAYSATAKTSVLTAGSRRTRSVTDVPLSLAQLSSRKLFALIARVGPTPVHTARIRLLRALCSTSA
jgi:hypothetical protein